MRCGRGARFPAVLARRQHERYGPVVRFDTWPFTVVHVFGDEANRLLLLDRPEGGVAVRRLA